MHRSLVLLALVAGTSAGAAGLSAAERKIVAVVDANRAAAMTLVEEAVNIQSATENHAGVRKVGDVFARELAAIGFDTHWVDLPSQVGRAGHLVAVHRGNRGKRLLLIGHLDTVLQGEAFRVEGDRAYGTGIADMKGGDVIVVEALRALHATGALEGRQVIVVFTGDEEDTGVPQSESRKALFEAASQSDVALAFEGAAPGVAVVGRRGIGTWRLHVTGEQAHSSGIFRESRGYGAIFETARILDRFRIDLPEQYLTYNPSVMVGGTTVAFDPATSSGTALGKTNVIPREAYVTGDIRFLTSEQFEAARARMQAIVRGQSAEDIGFDRDRDGVSVDGADRRQPAGARRTRCCEPRPRCRADRRAGPGRTRRRRHFLRLHGAPRVSRRSRRDGRERPRSRRVHGDAEHAYAHPARRVADVQAHSLTRGRALEMQAPTSSWIFLLLALLGLLMTVTGLARATRLGWGNMFWFLSGWLTSELALFHILLSAAVALCFWWWSDAFHFLPAQFGLVILGVSWAGLLVTQWRSRPTERVLEQALVTGLGAGYRDSIPAPRRALLRESVPVSELALPFAMRAPGVEWLKDIAYADDGHERHVLDVYRPTGGCAGAPVLLQIHGGGWVVGNKHEQALPLVYHLAARGWIVVTPNYRLSPRARFPDHLVDCKRAFAWTSREHRHVWGRSIVRCRDRRLGRRASGGADGADRKRFEVAARL